MHRECCSEQATRRTAGQMFEPVGMCCKGGKGRNHSAWNVLGCHLHRGAATSHRILQCQKQGRGSREPERPPSRISFMITGESEAQRGQVWPCAVWPCRVSFSAPPYPSTSFLGLPSMLEWATLGPALGHLHLLFILLRMLCPEISMTGSFCQSGLSPRRKAFPDYFN